MIPNPSALKTSPDSAADRGLTLSQRILRGLDSVAAGLGRTSHTAPHLATGLRGEEEAFFYLKRRGYVVVARRWNTPKLPGDIDLIAWEGGTLCFIEVKTRTGRNIVPAEFAVDQQKQNTLRGLAAIYRKRLPESVRRLTPVRFDVVSVYFSLADTDLRVEIDLFPAAFDRDRS